MFDTFWIECTHDALKWGGLREDDSRDGTPPPATAWIDFDDVGYGNVDKATPAGPHEIMFEQNMLGELVV